MGPSDGAGIGGSVYMPMPETPRGSGHTGAQSDRLDLPSGGRLCILLRAGFDRWSAAKLQLSTAMGGLLGACFAICTQSPKGVGTGVVGGGGRWRSEEGPQPKAQLP